MSQRLPASWADDAADHIRNSRAAMEGPYRNLPEIIAKNGVLAQIATAEALLAVAAALGRVIKILGEPQMVVRERGEREP